MPVTVILVPLPATPIVSLPSTTVSWIGVTGNVPVPLVAFAAMVIVNCDHAS